MQAKDENLNSIRQCLKLAESDNCSDEMARTFSIDDQDLLWYSCEDGTLKLVLPKALVKDVLAFIHVHHRHPGIAVTTNLVRQNFHWKSVVKDTTDYVSSCSCRRRKQSQSHKTLMKTPKLLQPWEVLEIDLLDMKHPTVNGNRYILIVVDKASRFLSATPVPSKEAKGVAAALLKLLCALGVPREIRSDAGREFKANVVHRLCQWMKVQISHGPGNNPRGQGTAERTGAWLQGVLSELCAQCPDHWDEYVMPACWIRNNLPDAALSPNLTPFRVLLGRNPRTALDTLLPSPDGEVTGGDVHAFVDRQKQVFKETGTFLNP